MYRVINRDELKEYLEKGYTTRKISELTGYGKSTVSYHIVKMGLTQYCQHEKRPTFSFGKIDTKEKAYALGFILADGSIGNNNIVEISTEIADREVVDFISKVIDTDVHTDMTLDRKHRRFPRARASRKVMDITKFSGGTKKADRHFPIVSKSLEIYLLRGFFDGDGSISFGHRKDRDRFWIKISFTSQFKLLAGIQNMLLKNFGIASQIRPKSNEKCYVMTICAIENSFKFLDALYSDKSFIILKRKYAKYKAARLELEENGEGSVKTDNTVPSLQEQEGVETRGEQAVVLNYPISIQDASSEALRYSPNRQL